MLAKGLHEFRFPPSATNSAGIAKSAVLTANGTVGSYAVTGKAGTATNSPGFQLRNQYTIRLCTLLL